MSMTRKEILDLRSQWQQQCNKIEDHEGGIVDPIGLRVVDREIGKNPSGQPPSLALRNLGRLLKHYIEEVKTKPSAVIQFNVAAGLVGERGMDVQQAIRQAKRAVRESVTTMEQEGYCNAATHTHLRVDKHDRNLQAILEM